MSKILATLVRKRKLLIDIFFLLIYLSLMFSLGYVYREGFINGYVAGYCNSEVNVNLTSEVMKVCPSKFLNLRNLKPN